MRGFVSMLVEGLDGTTVEDVLAVPADLVHRAGMPEILGMLRLGGLNGVLRRLKAQVARASMAQADAPAGHSSNGTSPNLPQTSPTGSSLTE